MNAYEYCLSNPLGRRDPYGMESIGLELGKLLLELPPVKEKTEELKQGALDLGKDIWGSMSTLEKGLAIAFAGWGGYEYYDTGRPISASFGFGFSFLGIDWKIDLSLTLQKTEGGGPSLPGSGMITGTIKI